jgi:hypothetical protein
MWFRLVYRGVLPPGHRTQRTADKFAKRSDFLQTMRRVFHRQLQTLWKQEPLKGHAKYLDPKYAPDDCLILEDIGAFTFAPLVTKRLMTFAELDILMLRPSPPGELFGHGGDIDNRIKTLLDALRMPRTEKEIPVGDQPAENEKPFHCALQDDALVTQMLLDTDRLLDAKDDYEVMLVVKVTIRASRSSFANIGMVT